MTFIKPNEFVAISFIRSSKLPVKTVLFPSFAFKYFERQTHFFGRLSAQTRKNPAGHNHTITIRIPFNAQIRRQIILIWKSMNLLAFVQFSQCIFRKNLMHFQLNPVREEAISKNHESIFQLKSQWSNEIVEEQRNKLTKKQAFKSS